MDNLYEEYKNQQTHISGNNKNNSLKKVLRTTTDEELLEFYSNRYEDVDVESFLKEQRREQFEGLLNLITNGEFYINIGCATGGHMQQLYEKGIYGIGIDISIPNIIKGLRDKPHLKFIHGFAESIPFRDEFFDIAMLGDVLEHFRDIEQTLAEILRVVKNGFAICFANDNLETEEHVNPLTLNRFMELCNEFKLRIELYTHEGQLINQIDKNSFYWIFARVYKSAETNPIVKRILQHQKAHQQDIKRVIEKDQWSLGENHMRHETELDRFEITSLAITGNKILEVGCGNGDLSVFLAKKGYNVTGIDISSEGIKQCKNFARNQGVDKKIHFHVMDAISLQFNDNCFDSVIFSEVFEHIISSRSFIEEGIRVLIPGGRIYISVPDSLQIHWPGHIRFFTKLTLKNELEQYTNEVLFHEMNYKKWLICTFTPIVKPGKISESFPTVDIIMATFNRPELLCRSIQSVISQTYQNWTLYIINDGGIDVLEKVEGFNDNRLKYFQKNHSGKPAAINFALEKSLAPYISYMDDDDIIYPNHIESLIKSAVFNNKEFVYSDTLFTKIDKHTNNIIVQYPENTLDVNYEMLQYRNYINHKQILHTRKLTNKVGPYDISLSILIDWDYIRRLGKQENPHHIKLITGNHIVYSVNGKLEGISGLWTKDPDLTAQSLLKIYSKDASTLISFYGHFLEDHETLTSLKSTVLQYQEDLKNIHEKLTGYEQKIDDLYHSYSWKITSPFRWAYPKIIKLFYILFPYGTNWKKRSN